MSEQSRNVLAQLATKARQPTTQPPCGVCAQPVTVDRFVIRVPGRRLFLRWEKARCVAHGGMASLVVRCVVEEPDPDESNQDCEPALERPWEVLRRQLDEIEAERKARHGR